MDIKLKNFAISLLRKGTFRWKPRGEAYKKAKVEVGKFSTGRAKYGYQCNNCKEAFMAKEVKMDHIAAVVDPIDGFQGFDIYIERMFCEEENFQCICKPCHDAKTAKEREFKKRAKTEDLDELRKEYNEWLEIFK